MRLLCSQCGQGYDAGGAPWRCGCGGPLDLDFHPEFDFRSFGGREPGLWRYREALPIEDRSSVVSLGEGGTPMVPADILGAKVHLKLEYLAPSGSFKDRGASVLISHARELGIEAAVEDSSGNAGAAISAYCAAARIACEIYVPEATSSGKTAQIEAAGARLVRVPGDREKTAEAVRKRAGEIFYASHYWNPYFFHGTKTFAYEVVEQLGGRAPDVVIFPVGHGSLLYGSYIGFRELQANEVIGAMPALIAVQAEGFAPLSYLWRGMEFPGSADKAGTVAEGIRVRKPARAGQIIRAVEETGGEVVEIGDDEIAAALAELAGRGFFVEPTSAVPLAALGKLGLGEGEIVIPLTGSGLKASLDVSRLVCRGKK